MVASPFVVTHTSHTKQHLHDLVCNCTPTLERDSLNHWLFSVRFALLLKSPSIQTVTYVHYSPALYTRKKKKIGLDI